MAHKHKLQDMVDAAGYDDEVAKAVLDHAVSLGNARKIESGELVLPSPQDAWHWHMRETGRAGMTQEQVGQQARITALEQLVRELAANQSEPSAERQTVIQQRIAELNEAK